MSTSTNGAMMDDSSASERARKIEYCISSVIANSTSAGSSSGQFDCAVRTSFVTTSARGITNELYSPMDVTKPKSLASALPSLTGVMLDSSLSALSSSCGVTVAMNICGPAVSATTTTATRSSRHLQLVGDLPENVLETSCTPPSSPAKSVSGQYQQNVSSGPVFASLAPVSIGNDAGSTSSSVALATTMFASTAPLHSDAMGAGSSSALTPGAIFSASNAATALTQLFPMATGGSPTSMPQAFLAVKVEPDDIVFASASPPKSGGSTTTCSAAILSPVHFSLSSGAVTSPTFTTLAAVAGGADGDTAVVSSSHVGHATEFLSLQPAALYLQPVQPNGQVQYVRVELPASMAVTSSAAPSSSAGGKPSSNVSTIELAHSIIATMFQQSAGSMPASVATTAPEHSGPIGSAVPILTTVDQLLGPKSESDASLGNIRQRTVPAGITVTPRVAAEPAPALVASRKKASSASQARQQQSVSKDAAGASFSGEDESDEIYIDTKELCNRIAYELKTHSIPQAVFAERVLCRSQGTLSDLLRNPKPWNKLKSGRETFRRMYVWLKQPLEERLAYLELWKGSKRKSSTGGEASQTDANQTMEPSGDESVEEMSGDGVVFEAAKEILGSTGEDVTLASASIHQVPVSGQDLVSPGKEQASPDRQRQRIVKKPRLVFTDIQKRTLQAIFKETQRPSREMQQTIAEHLNLDLSTVQNFFMNARRRSRIEQADTGDSPTPFQHVHPITPPPASVASPFAVADVGNGSNLTTAMAVGKSRPKRPSRSSVKQKQAVDPTVSAHVSMVNDGDLADSLVFSGSSASPLANVADSADEGSLNGTEQVQAIDLKE